MPNPNPDTDTLPHRLQRLEDLEAIRDLKAHYARRGDAVFRTPGAEAAEALAALFTDDGILDLGPFGRYVGRAAIRAAAENVLPQGTAWSTHYIVNPLLDINGAEATGSWYFLIYAQLKSPPHAPVAPIFGAYQDRYRKTPDGWRFAESVASYAAPAP